MRDRSWVRRRNNRRKAVSDNEDIFDEALVGILTYIVLRDAELMSERRTIVGRIGNIQRVRRQWSVWEACLEEKEFSLRYGMTKSAFTRLADALRPHIEPRAIARGSGHTAERAICCELRLAVTMRWLRGGSYIDIADWAGIERDTVRTIFWSTIHAMDGCDMLDTIHMPLKDDAAGQERVAATFAKPGEPFDRVAGALDGVHFAIASREPMYINYKG